MGADSLSSGPAAPGRQVALRGSGRPAYVLRDPPTKPPETPHGLDPCDPLPPARHRLLDHHRAGDPELADRVQRREHGQRLCPQPVFGAEPDHRAGLSTDPQHPAGHASDGSCAARGADRDLRAAHRHREQRRHVLLRQRRRKAEVGSRRRAP
jgi:hypothetical protein